MKITDVGFKNSRYAFRIKCIVKCLSDDVNCVGKHVIKYVSRRWIIKNSITTMHHWEHLITYNNIVLEPAAKRNILRQHCV